MENTKAYYKRLLCFFFYVPFEQIQAHWEGFYRSENRIWRDQSHQKVSFLCLENNLSKRRYFAIENQVKLIFLAKHEELGFSFTGKSDL